MSTEKQKDSQETVQLEEESTHPQEDLDQLEVCQKELQEVKDTYLRAVADFANYKRRTEQEQVYWLDSGQSTLMLDVLAVFDDFDRALQEHRKKERTPEMEAWLEGYELIGKELHKLLDKYRVQEIKNYTTFDPEVHEALMQVESDKHQSGEIVEVMQKGFTFKDKLLRPAKVSVVK